jgi:hypothetical protein
LQETLTMTSREGIDGAPHQIPQEGRGKCMINIHTSDSIKPRDSTRVRKGFLFADATFLLMAGGMAMLPELLLPSPQNVSIPNNLLLISSFLLYDT